jgi:hypothetical protein
MKTTDSAHAIILKGKEAVDTHDEAAKLSFLDTLLMFPAGAIGLIIGTFPLSLPILYLIALWMME